MKARLSCVSLPVDNLEAAVRFYRDGLGMPVTEPDGDDERDHVAIETEDGIYIVLLEREDFVDFTGPIGNGASSKGLSEVILSYFADDKGEVDAVLSAAQRAGAKVVNASDQDWGYAGYFTDLDGHLWEVTYNPDM